MKARKASNQNAREETAKMLSTMSFDETLSYVRTNVVAGFKMFPAAGQTFDALLEKIEIEYNLLRDENATLKAELASLKGDSIENTNTETTEMSKED